jgi:hypothetical protein
MIVNRACLKRLFSSLYSTSLDLQPATVYILNQLNLNLVPNLDFDSCSVSAEDIKVIRS